MMMAKAGRPRLQLNRVAPEATFKLFNTNLTFHNVGHKRLNNLAFLITKSNYRY